mgnify:CR=1 FL=1
MEVIPLDRVSTSDLRARAAKRVDYERCGSYVLIVFRMRLVGGALRATAQKGLRQDSN